jgi:type 1 fimbria pilin
MALMSERGVNLQQGEEFTLHTLGAEALAQVNTLGTAVAFYGERRRFIILLNATVCDTDAGDHLDVYIDVLISGTTWINAIHFTQLDGTGAAFMEYAILDAQYPGTASIDVTSDAAETTVRPSAFGSQMRARWTVTDAGAANATFTFAVTGYAL